MEASKLMISPKVRHGNTSWVDVLRWLQKHPKIMKRSSGLIIANTYCLENGGEVAALRSHLGRMIQKNILTRTAVAWHRYDFRINYLHPDIPEDMLQNMSDEEREFVQKVHEKAEKMGGTVLPSGAISVKREVESQEESEDVSAIPSIDITKDGVKISLTINLNLKLEK